MKLCQLQGPGLFLALLILAGCQSTPVPPAVAKPEVQKQAPAGDSARWQVDMRPTSEHLLAERTREYANAIDSTGSSSMLSQSDPAPDSLAQFPPDRPKHKTQVTIPLDQEVDQALTASSPKPNSSEGHAIPDRPSGGADRTTSNLPNAAAEDPNQRAQIASLKEAAERHPLGDVPRILPESADFGAAKSATPPPRDALEYRLQKRARDNPHDIAAQLDLQLLAMLKDEPSPELAMTTPLPREDREIINTLIDGLTDFRSAVREDETMLQAKKIRPLLEMVHRLQSQADLAVPTVALCRRVQAFGEYDPISPARFPAGRESKVIVYCEVENFQSKKIDANWWETRLTEQVTLYTDTGQFVWEDKPRAISDQSHRQRRDFYSYELLQLPADLTIGRYVLKVSISDENAGKVAEQSVDIAIGATEAKVDR